MEKSRLIFITGGARSGKSSFAEKYAINLAEKEDLKLYYVATANKSDDEMIDRIKRHQEDRKDSRRHWHTMEIPSKLGRKVNEFPTNSIVLLDCLTILLSNELFQSGFYEEDSDDEAIQTEVTNVIIDGINALARHVEALVIVSNEVVYDPVSNDQKIVQMYRKILGTLHQKIVRKSVEAYAVESGIPMLMKGGHVSCVE